MIEFSNEITDIPGIQIGHYTDLDAITGCTVILCKDGATCGVDQRGGAPGTREIALLNPINQVQKVHAVLLSGGSAFGLDAASGVMKYLEENKIGYSTGVAKVPIVPSAILFDLAIGNPNIRPSQEMGYQACLNASDSPPKQGSVGVGTGATIGKLLGMNFATKAGVGAACTDIGKGVLVGAIVAVNAVGDVIDPSTNQVLAGTRSPKIGQKLYNKDLFVDSLELMKSSIGRTVFSIASKSNTVIGVIVTNANLSKLQMTKVAQMGQNGLARSIRPANTMQDGDTLFALSIGKKKADVNIVGAFAAQAVQQAIINAVRTATTLGGIPALSDLSN